MVKNAVSVSAYAKINLHLEVLGKRKDGFHDIVSVFSPISLADQILVEKKVGDLGCSVYSPLFELPCNNTIARLYEEFKNYSGISDGIAVKLIKNIPVGAGLGGGSSDAAALLLALNSIFNTRLTKKELNAIALKIGSDVPFFLENKLALVTGRGECVKPISADWHYFGVLVYPDIQSSTKLAYDLLGRNMDDNPASFNPEDFCNLDCCKWPFFNSFEDALFEEHFVIKEVKRTVVACGADFALMSGAGSSVFGLFSDEKRARMAYFDLLGKYKSTFLFFLLAF